MTQEENWLQLEIIHASDQLVIGSWGNVFISLVLDSVDTQNAVTLIQKQTHFAARNPEGICMLTVIKKGASIPKGNVRRELAKCLHKNNIIFSATVMESQGFFAAANRAFITGLTLLSSHDYPHKIFTSLRDCSKWVEDMCADKLHTHDMYSFSVRKAVKDLESVSISRDRDHSVFEEDTKNERFPITLH